MIHVEPYRAKHLHALDLQEGQKYIGPNLTPEHAKELEGVHAITVLNDGRVLAVAGIIEVWPGRAFIWSYIDQQAGQHMVAIHRVAQRMVAGYEGSRLEADVDLDFEPGHRWMTMLGFKLETACMPKYRPDGGAMSKYVRIR